MAANEASAVGSIRTINTSAVTYSSTYPTNGFPLSLVAMGGANPCVAAPANACLLDPVLSAGTKSGYVFTWTGDGNLPSVNYTIVGVPVVLNSSGQRGFYSDQSGVIRYTTTGAPPTVASPPLQ